MSSSVFFHEQMGVCWTARLKADPGGRFLNQKRNQGKCMKSVKHKWLQDLLGFHGNIYYTYIILYYIILYYIISYYIISYIILYYIILYYIILYDMILYYIILYYIILYYIILYYIILYIHICQGG